MFTRLKSERERERDRDRDRETETTPFRRRKNPRPPMLSLPRSNSIKKLLPSKTGRIEEETACGIMWSVAARRGRRRTVREDTYTALPFITDICGQPISVFGIFDGHGGQRASQFASKRLADIFLERLSECGDVRKCLEYAFLATDEELLSEFSKRPHADSPRITTGSSLSAVSVQNQGLGRKNSSLFSRRVSRNSDVDKGTFEGSLRRGKLAADEQISRTSVKTNSGCGCTATMVAMLGHRIFLAHVGDSHAVLSTKREIRRLCEDHRPGRPDEQKRIESSGGLVLEISGTHRVNGVLAVSRSIGDADLKDFVIAKPEITEIVLKGEEEFLVVATDGLWDVVCDEDCVKTVRKVLCNGREAKEELAAKKLIESAWNRGSNDDTCILVINLSKYLSVCRRDVAEHAEFLSPAEGIAQGRPQRHDRFPQLHGDGLPVELVTPHADPAPTPRAGKKAW